MKWITVLLVLFAFDASASAHRPQKLLLPWYPGMERCTGDYVVVGKFGVFESEIARVACADLPKCIDIVGLWPDSLIYGFVDGVYLAAIRRPPNPANTCPREPDPVPPTPPVELTL